MVMRMFDSVRFKYAPLEFLTCRSLHGPVWHLRPKRPVFVCEEDPFIVCNPSKQVLVWPTDPEASLWWLAGGVVGTRVCGEKAEEQDFRFHSLRTLERPCAWQHPVVTHGSQPGRALGLDNSIFGPKL